MAKPVVAQQTTNIPLNLDSEANQNSSPTKIRAANNEKMNLNKKDKLIKQPKVFEIAQTGKDGSKPFII